MTTRRKPTWKPTDLMSELNFGSPDDIASELQEIAADLTARVWSQERVSRLQAIAAEMAARWAESTSPRLAGANTTAHDLDTLTTEELERRRDWDRLRARQMRRAGDPETADRMEQDAAACHRLIARRTEQGDA